MSLLPRNNNVAAVVTSFQGVPITGLMKGSDQIKVVQAGDDYSVTQGSDGYFVYNQLINGLWIATLSLAEGCPAIAQLSRLHQIDIRTGLGAGVFDINDLLGNLLFSCNKARMQKHPDLMKREEAGAVEVNFFCPDPEYTVGELFLA